MTYDKNFVREETFSHIDSRKKRTTGKENLQELIFLVKCLNILKRTKFVSREEESGNSLKIMQPL
jgi:hypothetical protein